MFSIQNGKRILRFQGEKLAHSSSKGPNSTRWVEFTLYRTDSGKYVVERVGVSVVFHSVHCAVLRRNSGTSDALPAETISDTLVPCPECLPLRDEEQYLVPENIRHRAQVCASAESVISSLKQSDANKTEYLTNVALRLLEDAAEADPLIADAFYVEEI